MPKYTVNERVIDHARDLISRRQYVLESDWGEAQPAADDGNRFLTQHDWESYAS